MSTPMDLDETNTPTAKEQTHLKPLVPERIRALDPSVVNLIAAGEIITAPVNALKELIENSVDAGATSIEIHALDGGLKMLQIQDNGSGIDENDLPLLCLRHATSKIQCFEDLRTITTYGFRGEALASISQIAHVKVTTKIKASPFAWTAKYNGPDIIGSPSKGAGVQGTRITIEDLFYNVPIRRRAFRAGNDEFNKILDMVARYATHCWKVSFTCKKLDAKGGSKISIQVPSNPRILERIRNVYGTAVANELFEFAMEEARYSFKASGWASNANFSVKRMQLVLFINHRSVESSNIKRAIEQTYNAFLPKGSHPWVYLSLEIEPRNVDVNIHPTKREVHFLAEDEIIQCICEEIRSKMAAVDSSRTFYTQTLLPGAPGSRDATNTPSSAAKTPNSNRKGAAPRNDSTLVRTDATARKITSMLPVMDTSAPSGAPQRGPTQVAYERVDQEEKKCRLFSIRNLRKQVRESMHNEGTEILGTHTFVGILSPSKQLAIIQGGRQLYIVNYGPLARDLFYQLGLTLFMNLGAVRLSPPLQIKPLVKAGATRKKMSSAALRDDAAYDPDEIAEEVTATITAKWEMLSEYFSMDVTPNGELRTLPLLLKGYNPSVLRIPSFLLKLGHNVCWDEEQPCFETLLRELADFYAPEPLPDDDDDRQEQEQQQEEGKTGGGDGADADGDMEMEGKDDQSQPGKIPETTRSSGLPPEKVAAVKKKMAARRQHVLHAVEHVIFPCIKEHLIVTKHFMEKGIVEVADLKNLYRTFERC